VQLSHVTNWEEHRQTGSGERPFRTVEEHPCRTHCLKAAHSVRAVAVKVNGWVGDHADSHYKLGTDFAGRRE
jgi:hypothetical protein